MHIAQKNCSLNIIGWFTRSQAGTVSASEDEVTGFASLPCKWHQMFEKLVLSAQQKYRYPRVEEYVDV